MLQKCNNVFTDSVSSKDGLKCESFTGIRSAFFSKHQITTVALSLFGPCEVVDRLLAENMALANFELYENPKTGGRHINID